MNTHIYSFLGEETNSDLLDIRHRLSETSKEIKDYLNAGASEGGLLVASPDADEWLTNLPHIIGHQIITTKLSSRNVYGLERAYFEEKLGISKHIRKYVSRFSDVDISSNDYCYQLLKRMSISMEQADRDGRHYHDMNELLNDSSLRMLIASILFEIGGYNTFNGLYYEIDILALMAKLDTPINLINEETVIPVRVFSDFVEIEQTAELVKDICQIKIGNNVNPHFASFTDEIDLDRYEFEKKLRLYTEKYPCLKGQHLSCLGKYLIHHYTLDPLDMINRHGQEIVCCPFRIPEKFQLTEEEKWSVSNTWPDANKARILF